MSITETATGNPATTASFVVRIAPLSHKATSVEVPPMSNVITFLIPADRAARNAPTTPPDGPERIVRTGSAAATSAEILPPDDCITRKLSFEPSACKRFKYRPINGCKYALITTVDVRSYSRYSGKIRLEIDNGTPSDKSVSAIRSSCSGCRNENNNEIATDSTSPRFNRSTNTGN